MSVRQKRPAGFSGTRSSPSSMADEFEDQEDDNNSKLAGEQR